MKKKIEKKFFWRNIFVRVFRATDICPRIRTGRICPAEIAMMDKELSQNKVYNLQKIFIRECRSKILGVAGYVGDF